MPLVSKKCVEDLTSLCYCAQSNQVEDKYPKNKEGIKSNFGWGRGGGVNNAGLFSAKVSALYQLIVKCFL